MMRKIILCLLMVTLVMGETRTIKRQRVTLREGPGAYYRALAELQAGTSVNVLEDDTYWPRVTVEDLTGYVSAKAFIGKSETGIDPMAMIAAAPAPRPEISNAGVSAAVKGFAERFGERLEVEPGFLDRIMGYQIDPARYETFRRLTYQDVRPAVLRRRFDLPKLPRDRNFTFAEEGSGIAIASRLASLGLMDDPDVVAYVNYVGHHVAESSHGYEIPFRFFILDVDQVNGYACPGGIIFITRGALEMMQDEAQLACFLAHEIAHVIYRHGMAEMEERRESIIAGNAFAELNRLSPLEERMDQTVSTLEDAFMEAYETIFAGRLSDYEEEADAVALIYAARAGYDPHAMLSFLEACSVAGRFADNEHYAAATNELRIQRIQRLIRSDRNLRKAKDLHTFPERFSTYGKQG